MDKKYIKPIVEVRQITEEVILAASVAGGVKSSDGDAAIDNIIIGGDNVTVDWDEDVM